MITEEKGGGEEASTEYGIYNNRTASRYGEGKIYGFVSPEY